MPDCYYYTEGVGLIPYAQQPQGPITHPMFLTFLSTQFAGVTAGSGLVLCTLTCSVLDTCRLCLQVPSHRWAASCIILPKVPWAESFLNGSWAALSWYSLPLSVSRWLVPKDTTERQAASTSAPGVRHYSLSRLRMGVRYPSHLATETAPDLDCNLMLINILTSVFFTR